MIELFNNNTPVGKVIESVSKLSFDGDLKQKYKKIIDENELVENESPFLSVVTRTQGNRPHALRELFLCLSAQSDMDFEVLLLGHDVSEENKQIVLGIIEEQVSELRDKINYIPVNGGTRTTPLNYGFAMSHGKYISILDDDDLVLDNWVENFRLGAKECEGRIIRAYSFTQDWLMLDESEGISGLRAQSAPKPTYCDEFDMLEQLNSNNCPTMSLAYPSYIFKKAGVMFDETLNTTEDWDYLMNAALLCGVYDTKEATSIYRLWENANNSHIEHDNNEWIKNHLDIQRKLIEKPVILLESDVKPFLKLLSEYDDISSEDVTIHEPKNSKKLIITCGHKLMVKPKLYLDFGKGLSEANTLFGNLSLKKNRFEVIFNIGMFNEITKAFRIDISEDSFFAVNSLKLNITYKDFSNEEIEFDKLMHNGFVVEEGLVYLRPDPQLVYNVKNNRKINSIKLSGEFVDCDINAIFDRVMQYNSILGKVLKKFR